MADPVLILLRLVQAAHQSGALWYAGPLTIGGAGEAAERAGYVERSPDHRALVRLTDAGRAALATLRARDGEA